MPVDLVEVESSNIAKIGYDPETQTLYIKFKGGSLWSYRAVPPEEYQRLAEAKSVGKHFAGWIRPNPRYEAKQIVETEEEETS